MDQRSAIETHDVVVIGAGQAGLAAGYHLAQHGIDHVILEGSGSVGDVWRERYDSLRLYSPARYDSLPGLPLPGDGNAFPTGRQMADYLERYAQHWDLPVRTEARVERLSNHADGYLAETSAGSFRAANFIVATGAFQHPHVPGFASDLAPSIAQVHAADYRRPTQLPEGPVLVVGVSHSGSDIAMELSQSRTTYLSGRSHGQLPVSVDSRAGALLWPLAKALFTRVLTLDTPIGRRMAPKVRAGGGPLLRNRGKDLRRAGVRWHESRTTGVTEGKPTLADGTVLDVASIVWCTGYRPDYSWIQPPMPADDGWPRQRRGVVEGAPGLYILGMPFLNSFASMLVLGAGADAGYVVDQLRRSAVHSGQGSVPALTTQ
jgi:putative flavoprotein involved in K+ transport